MAAELVLAPVALALALAGPGLDLRLQPVGVTLALTGADGCTLQLEPGPALLLAGLTPTLDIDADATEVALELAPILRGPVGPAGVSADGAIQLAFAWGDASPRQITVATGGKVVYEVELHIAQAFDGVGAQLQVGDAGQVDRLMSADQNDPAVIGSYASAPVHVYGADTSVLLTITPGDGATAGAGLLTFFIEQ